MNKNDQNKWVTEQITIFKYVEVQKKSAQKRALKKEINRTYFLGFASLTMILRPLSSEPFSA